jgi:pimeloyl-ACP methyl ester carboxylesterase
MKILSKIVLSAFAAIAACDGDNAASIEAEGAKTIGSAIPVRSGYAPVNGVKMYYEIHGKDQPLVLLHGGGSTIDTSFEKVLPSFAKARQVIAVELQGYGHTADIDRPLTFELKIENADFFGYSNGGNVALQIAIRHPYLVRKLVVASAFFNNNGLYPEIRASFFQACDT